MLRAAIALLLLLLLASTVHAEKRIALVIGNSSYRYAGELANPKNDATDIAAALRAHGFQVVQGLDLDKTGLERKLREFATALQGAQVGVFFYAGHGLQVSGANYIVPTDAQLTTVAALELEVTRFEAVQRIMESEDRTNILFFDACRDNPLARNLQQAMGTRSTAIGRGLAPVQSGYGTLISYSTQPGNVALDGSGRNSPFTSALLRHLSSSDEEIMGLLRDVRNDVMRETQRRQIPWEHTALTARFYFKEVAMLPAPVAPQPQGLPPVAAPAPTSSRAEEERYSALVSRAITNYDNRDYDGAIAVLSEAMRLDPKNAIAFINRGHAYSRKGDTDRAFADFNEAIRLDPTYAVAFNGRGNAYSSKGDPNRAIADFSEAIRLDPKYAIAFSNRGNAYKRKGDTDRAIADYNEAIRLDPRFAAAFNNRGIAYNWKGDMNRAIADFNEAIRLDPRFADAYCMRGIVKLKIKQASGNADIEKARQLDVKCP